MYNYYNFCFVRACSVHLKEAKGKLRFTGLDRRFAQKLAKLSITGLYSWYVVSIFILKPSYTKFTQLSLLTLYSSSSHIWNTPAQPP